MQKDKGILNYYCCCFNSSLVRILVILLLRVFNSVISNPEMSLIIQTSDYHFIKLEPQVAIYSKWIGKMGRLIVDAVDCSHYCNTFNNLMFFVNRR